MHNNPAMHKVAIVALRGVVPFDLATATEVFGWTCTLEQTTAYEIRVCGEAKTVDAGTFGIRTEWTLNDIAWADTVVVPGLANPFMPIAKNVTTAVRAAADAGARVASICTGAFVLAAAGVLDGLRATTHWRAAAELARRYPTIAVDPNVLYVDNGQILTSAGAAAGLDLCLHMVRRDYGAAVAADSARLAVMPPMREGGQAQFIAPDMPACSSSLQPVLGWLEKNLQRPLGLDDIARRAATSTRTLSRRFLDQTGMTPLQWLLAARIRHARRLLETTPLSVERIATATGFGSATALRALRADAGHQPIALSPYFPASAGRSRPSRTMKHSPTRRALLQAAASLPFAAACSTRPTTADAGGVARDRLAALESATGGRLGVAALNSADGARIDHRKDERFPFCSTFKVLAAAAILRRSASESGLLQRHIVYAKDELVTYSPITAPHADADMTLAELCAAALQHSDNTAANLLLKTLGGPTAVTEFARSIGDEASRLDRWETALNSALPGDPRDTTTPAAMAGNLRRLLLGDALGPAERERLTAWMLGNTTGATRIRAGVPADWRVADKTGAGDYGTTNDVAVVWPPGKPPIVLAVYFMQREKDAPARNDVVAAAARIVADAFI